MSILQDRTAMSARVGRALSNALKVDLQVQDGVVAAHAQQKGSAGVLLGFRNGGKSRFGIDGDGVRMELQIAPRTTVVRNGQPLGSIVGTGTSARIEDAGGTVLAEIRPYPGDKADAAIAQPLTTPSGASLGTLTLMRTAAAWDTLNDITDLLTSFDFAHANSLKAPSGGALLRLDAPVDDVLGDLLAAALVDASVLPRAYVT